MAVNAPTIETMKRIKRALDPLGILNPGKMFV
jgi:FAD/FMN-containing dehydrogenase